MATKKRSTAVTKAAPGNTSIALLDQELANEVAALKGQIGQASGNKIKIEASGDFILPDGMNLGNEIQVIVVDFTSRNTFYATPYNPQSPAPPDCYAMGKVINDMVPEGDSPAVQNPDCRTCPLNAFGSGTNGKGKACQNRRLLAVLFVDPDNPDAHNAPDAPIYTLDLSPSNIKFFDGAVSHVARALGPPVKAIFTVTAKNVGTYAMVSFIDPLPNPDYAAHFARRAECQDMLYRRPDFTAAEAAKPARRAAPARRATSARR